MSLSLRHWFKWQAPAAAILFGLLVLPDVRHFLEASMTRHMLVQFPLVLLCGFGLARSLPRSWRLVADRWNHHGMSGLFAAALLLAILMIPRLLDLALVDGRIELAKLLGLLLCGGAIRLSWQAAGLMVQGFFLGNVLPMMAVVGTLFDSSPVRVCNAYLLDDQAGLGQKLVWITVLTGLVWFAALVRKLTGKEELPVSSDQAPVIRITGDCPGA